MSNESENSVRGFAIGYVFGVKEADDITNKTNNGDVLLHERLDESDFLTQTGYNVGFTIGAAINLLTGLIPTKK